LPAYQKRGYGCEAFAVVIDAAGAERLKHDTEHFVVGVARLGRIAAEPLVLHVANAAADARHEATVRELVDHADFLDQPRRMVERQAQHHGAEPNARCAPRDRGEEDDRRWGHVERREVVLGDVVAVEAVFLGALDQCHALVVLLR
jgi:hypothetical protein